MTRTVYLAGPMRGIPEFNFPAFLAADKVLESHDWAVYNPAQLDIDAGFEYQGKTGNEVLPGMADMLSRDLDLVSRVDGVVLLPGWEKSKGVRAELALAAALGTPVARYPGYDNGFPGLQWQSAEKFLAKWGMVNTGEPVRTCPSSAADEDNHGHGVTSDGALRFTVPAMNIDTDWGVDDLPVGSVPPAGYVVDDDVKQYNTGEVRVTSSTGGQKGSKLARFDLIPVYPLTALAEHYGKGAEKYADRNWELGTDWHLNYAALMRHATQFWAGEDIDEETGSPHMAAVAWHAFALLEFSRTHPELDDRPKGA